MIHSNFGLAWIAFALAVSLHVADEATHDFLSIYNPNARAIRARFHLPIPVFTSHSFILSLSAAIALLFLLTPLALHGTHWVRVAALPLGILIGVGNACVHFGASVFYRRWMPGVLSAPLLAIAGGWLFWTAWMEGPALF